MFDLKSHLRALVNAHGPSGHEAPVRALLREAWAGLVDEFREDGLGSLIGIRRATHPLETPRRIMLAAHMDEIALMVTDLRDGFLRVQKVGGMDHRILLAQPVLVHGRETLPGVVATKPPHLLTPANRTRYVPMSEILIDVGLPPERVAALVRPGDLITLDTPMVELNGTRVAGKAMDDRACVAAVTFALNALRGMHHTWDVYAVATVQEETGLLGATTSAYSIAPDIAIALDVGFAPQSGVEADVTIEIGGGPGIGVGPNFHSKLYDRIRETAKRYEIKLQDDYIPGASGTDAWAIQVALTGVPTALLEIPIRSMHSPVETADLRDIERCGRLLAHFIAELDADFLTALAWDDLKPQDTGADA
ncbi:M20/M25/M40 family metallo-hydrolase [Oscillatoria laete-virens NRMC-F 0139]|nr:M20/M25/M40 family metallo-hydrolase [Oscillatoria laete-virens]MDL5054071.1 M20/M25/M40 family metallo-hydrolase [Oscillatoria laete-virens NRMC-F 0139]